MGYYETGLLARDMDFHLRISACYGIEAEAQDPESWASIHQWLVAEAPGFGEAYAYALATGNPYPGRDPAVITDEQILAAVNKIRIDEGEIDPPVPPEDDLGLPIDEGEDDHA